MKRLLSIFSVTFLCIGLGAAPKGEILNLDINGSSIYPGTVRNVKVYVPQEYDGKTPACLIMRMDGICNDIPQAVDELISEGAMPVTICVFITSGRVFDNKDDVVRYNRSNEFDRMTPAWAEFLEYEVIPQVEKLSTSDGRRLLISRRSGDRAITGDSSGGIAAFNAAWQRPDLYGRVYSIVGTFVPFRGGDQFPALIRKSEPRALRIYLQDNDEDSWNLTFGSWYEYNLLMASALKFSGYDFQTHWDVGGHSGTNGHKIMKDVLRWLWAGWPEKIEARRGSNEVLNSILIDGQEWEKVPAMKGKASHKAVYPGNVFVARSVPHTNSISTAILDGGKQKYEEQFYWLHSEGGEDSGNRWIAFDELGWLYASSELGIQVCDHNGRVRAIISTPRGKIRRFSFEEDRLYVNVDGTVFCRRIGHKAATANSPVPKSQGQG